MITLTDLQKQIQRMYKQWPDVVVAESKSVLWLVVNQLQSDVIEKTPAGVSAAGGLRGSIFGEVRPFGNAVKGIVGSPLEYAPVVEFGRRAGSFPPVIPLELWVRRKLGIPSSESMSVAHAVAWKIYRHGFEGSHMFGDTWRQKRPWVESMLNTIPERVFRRVNR